MDKTCTLLVNSYDGGEDLWYGFFSALKHEWPEFDYPIVLNTETKKYEFSGLNIKTYQLYKENSNVPWSKRLIETLKYIESEYVIFFLEDFWLEKPVDHEHFLKCLEWLKNNEDVAVFSFMRTRGKNIQDNRFERFEKRPQKGEYRMNCQAALWKKNELLKCLRWFETPWEWERNGSIRSRRYKKSIYTIIEGEKPVFTYNLSLGGAVHRGKWNKSVVEPLCAKYGIEIDYDKRGFNYETNESNGEYTFNLRKAIINRIRKLMSLI